MFCMKCGAEIINNSTYCITCGSLLITPGQQIASPACPPENKKMIALVYRKYPKKEIRNRLIESYSKTHPKRQVKRIISIFEKHIKDSGCENMPEHFGELVADRLLEGEHPFDLTAIYNNIDKAIAEGATRADIIDYYNLFFVQRMMIEWSEQLARETAMYFFAKEGIWSEDEIVSKIKKMFPIYVDPADTKYLQGEDRTLSPILRCRVSKYWSSIGTEKMTAIIQHFSSVNACVRYLIREGMI